MRAHVHVRHYIQYTSIRRRPTIQDQSIGMPERPVDQALRRGYLQQMQAHLRTVPLTDLVKGLFSLFCSQVSQCKQRYQPGVQCRGIVAVLGLAEVRTCGGYANHDRATAAIFAPHGIDTEAKYTQQMRDVLEYCVLHGLVPM